MSTGDLSTKNFSCLEVTWKINDFLDKPATMNSVLSSKSFPFAKANWQLELIPNVCEEDEIEGCIKLCLKRLTSSIRIHRLFVESFFMSRHGNKYDISSDEFPFCILKDSYKINYLKRAYFMNYTDFLLPKGTLTVCCYIRIEYFSKNESPKCYSFQKQIKVVSFPKEQNDASTQTETQDFNMQAEEIILETSSKIFLDFYRMPNVGDLSTEEPLFKEVTWKIDEFLDKPAVVNSVLTSESFSFAEADWQLELFPNGSADDDSKGFTELWLKRLKSSIPVHQFLIKCFFKSRDEMEYEYDSDEFSFHIHEPCSEIFSVTRTTLINLKDFRLPNDTLIACCQIRMESFSQSESPDGYSFQQQIGTVASPEEQHDASTQTDILDFNTQTEVLLEKYSSLPKLQLDYKKLLESQEEADIWLKVSNKKFRAHKCILMARSPVFHAMFKHDTKEKLSGEVVIEDMDPESFLDFLQYIYAGSMDALSERNVFQLYMAADKYDIVNLKSECRSYIKRTLSVDTFCDAMILALRYAENELLNLSTDFFYKNSKKIIKTVKFRNFCNEYKSEANELLFKTLEKVSE